MNSKLIPAAILASAAIIAAAIYLGLTEKQREYMKECTDYTIRSGAAPEAARYICTVQAQS